MNQERAVSPQQKQASSQLPKYESSELLKGNKCVFISHDGARYRLQQTRNGKLILQK
ncbi:MAG: hemin uptake protein HemP [Planctomycetota bacterium]